ncbi:GNAT family N-acetyltransferase [Vulcaniibacterium tengchongense]|uniref:Acetyltransferase (GNAT) family protein n=1 Tax=Vulcaniibacterium tengchongense TaxID=1273429 RepID=A0A3N4VKN1_9GAMM|nr:GNAT family N-acetyltransferase [Vulcaniibacterium tengchongense]RPE81975.1 acetyltransferase (GNAT) family protein [Vulcaniibacterium tengchongense]
MARATETELTVRALARGDWPRLEALFGRNGACGGCWCMWWRLPNGGKAWAAAKGEPNRAAFRALVESGAASGVLAFAGAEPVGWCAIGPRSDFPRLERSKALARGWSTGTWSLNCLYVPARWRGRGVARALVGAAVAYARECGAAEIEAYPQAVRPGERQPGAFVWTGVPSLFEACGFEPLRPVPRGRGLYLLRLR